MSNNVNFNTTTNQNHNNIFLINVGPNSTLDPRKHYLSTIFTIIEKHELLVWDIVSSQFD